MTRDETTPVSAGYQVLMLVLCLYALAALGVRSVADLRPETVGVIDYADYAVCMLFFADFVVSLVRAPDRKRYLLTWGWLDLLSSIPTIDAARWGRLARVARLFRVLRGLRATKLLVTLVLKRRAESTFLTASLVALLLLIFSSIAVLHFETDPQSNIKSAEDAVWWAFATITTVGYGDRYPVTPEGRFVAAILMCGGVGLFGIFSGFLAAWLIEPEVTLAPAAAELAAVRDELAALREAIARLEQGRTPTG